MNQYIMSNDAPRLIPYTYDLLEGVPDVIPDFYKPYIVPNGDYWPNHVGRTLDFAVVNRFPIYSDGSGCHILARVNTFDNFVFKNHRARDYQYLALLKVANIAYAPSIIVAIKDEAALLQFYRLIHPMLMLQSDYVFGWDGSKKD